MDEILVAIIANFPTFSGLVVTIVVLLRENGFRRQEIAEQAAYIRELTSLLVEYDVITSGDIAHIRAKDYNEIVPPSKRNKSDFG